MIKVTALLPMKGNSERVPNKNLKDFSGKPLYHRVLDTLLDSKYISAVVINTDSAKIKKDALESYGDNIVIHDRPIEIQGDLVSMNKVIENDVLRFESDIYLQTHSTNPLLTTASIDNAMALFLEPDFKDNYDSLFSVTKIQTRLYDENGKAFNHNPQKLIRTQDLPPLFEENSNFFIFTKESFMESGLKRIGKKPKMFEIDKIEAIDIDDPQDFLIAETLYKTLRKESTE